MQLFLSDNSKIEFTELEHFVKISSFQHRCFQQFCRGVLFNQTNCQTLYETTDIEESERNNYNQISVPPSGENKLVLNGLSLFIVSFLNAGLTEIRLKKNLNLNLKTIYIIVLQSTINVHL